MARKTDIRLRRSATSGAIPTTSQLNLGELAINTYDGKLFLKKDVGGTESVIEIGAGEAQNTIWTEFQYTATSNQTTFSGSDSNGKTLTYLTGYTAVYINGVLQKNTTDYAATSGSSVVLVNGLSAGDIVTVHAFAKVLGTGDVTRNTYSGNGSTTAFTLGSDPEGENNLQVFIDGVYQEKSTFSQSGTTLTFSTAPANGTTIEVMLHTRNVSLGNINDLNVGSNLTVQGYADLDLFALHSATTKTYEVKVVTKTSAHRYYGSGSSSGYTIDGVESPGLRLYPGRTYKFDQSDSSNSGHPFRFYEEANKTTAYTTGVTTNGTAGSSGAYTQIVVSDSTPLVLHYQCSSHGYMGNQINALTGAASISSTDDVSEGSSNLYYTNARADARIALATGANLNLGSKDTDDLSEGSSNLYYTNARVTSAITGSNLNMGSNNITTTGKILYSNVYSVEGDLPSASTYHGMFAHVHGTGKGYFAHGGNWIKLLDESSSTTTNLTEGTNLYYTNARADARIAAATTDDVSEGSSNLYYTNARADARITNALAGNITITGNLTVNGTQTTLNTATLSVEDLNITVGKNATTSSAANGAGITFGAWSSGTIPTLTWDHSNARFAMNKSLAANIVGNVTGNVSGSSGSTTGNAATATALATSRNISGVAFNGTADITLNTSAITENTNLYYTDARVSTRADTILNHSNHSNITVSKVGSELRFAAGATYGNSDVETYLDANGTTFPDNVKAQFGTGNDLQISHDGTNSHIANNTGYMAIRTSTANSSLFLHGDNVHLRSQTGNEAMLTGVVNGALTLYYNNSAKLATTNSGVQTTGTVNVNGAFALPTADGSSNQVLQTDGSGTVSWATVSASNSSGLVSETFKNILVSGQSNIVADSATDSLTIAAGSGITLTTNAGTDTLTITNSAVGDNAFKTIAVSGQTSVVADSTTDTLTLVGTNGVDITTNAGTDTITIDGKTSYSPFTTDLFTTANASTTAFVLSKTPSSENNLIVFLEGVYQNKNSYTLSSSTLTLDSAPASGQEVVVHIIGDIVSGEALVRNNFTGDGSTTAFTMTIAPMNENNVYVYSDGVYQEKSEFSVSGTTLTFGSAPASAASLEILIPKATEINQPATASIDDSAMFNQSAIIPQVVTSTTVGSTSATTIATHAIATYRSVNYQVQITQGTDYHMTSINVIHDGTTAHFTEYGTVFDNASLATFDATISSGNLLLQVTMGSASSSTIKVISSAVTV